MKEDLSIRCQKKGRNICSGSKTYLMIKNLQLESTSENKNGKSNEVFPLLPSNHLKGNWLADWELQIRGRYKVLTEITLSPTHSTLSLWAAPPSAMREI